MRASTAHRLKGPLSQCWTAPALQDISPGPRRTAPSPTRNRAPLTGLPIPPTTRAPASRPRASRPPHSRPRGHAPQPLTCPAHHPCHHPPPRAVRSPTTGRKAHNPSRAPPDGVRAPVRALCAGARTHAPHTPPEAATKACARHSKLNHPPRSPTTPCPCRGTAYEHPCTPSRTARVSRRRQTGVRAPFEARPPTS